MASTLKDIAQALNVTTTTVHKALHGKPGVSEATRLVVQQKAQELGYMPNYLAASLKGRILQIALVLPENAPDNRYYYATLMQGIERAMAEFSPLKINLLEYTYPLTRDANGAALERVYNEHADRLDGVICTIADEARSSYFVKQFAQKNIPLVFIGTDVYPEERLCCVKGNDEMAGSLAGELLTIFNDISKPKKIIVAGNYSYLGIRDQYLNALSFTDYLTANHPSVSILHAQGVTTAEIQTQIERILTEEPNVYALYACSARSTIAAVQARKHIASAANLHIIGNDYFPESVTALKDKHLTAIIDKQVAQQSFFALRTLLNFAAKGEYPTDKLIAIRPNIILQQSFASYTEF